MERTSSCEIWVRSLPFQTLCTEAREVLRGGSLFFAGVSPPWQGFSWRKDPAGLVPLNAREVVPRVWGAREFRCGLR